MRRTWYVMNIREQYKLYCWAERVFVTAPYDKRFKAITSNVCGAVVVLLEAHEVDQEIHTDYHMSYGAAHDFIQYVITGQWDLDDRLARDIKWFLDDARKVRKAAS